MDCRSRRWCAFLIGIVLLAQISTSKYVDALLRLLFKLLISSLSGSYVPERKRAAPNSRRFDQVSAYHNFDLDDL